MTDTIIVGGGAAGCMAAIQAARLGKTVLLFERNDRIGKKLRITGKGRCNVTNNSTVQEHMENIPVNSRFLYSSYSAFDAYDVMDFFESLGVPLKTERGNRVFPVSDRAEDIVQALSRELDRLGVRIVHKRVTALIIEDGSCAGVRAGGKEYRSQREQLIEKEGIEAADKVFPEYTIKDLEEIESVLKDAKDFPQLPKPAVEKPAESTFAGERESGSSAYNAPSRRTDRFYPGR